MFRDLIESLRTQSSNSMSLVAQQPTAENDFGEAEYIFDEEKFNRLQSQLLSSIISKCFPTEMQKNGLVLELSHSPVEKIPEDQLVELMSIVDANLGDFYTKVNGKNWKKDKIKEMKEDGLLYITMKELDTRSIIGFMSLKLVFDNEILVTYLYEIQLLQAYTGLKIGAELMNHFHQLPSLLNNGLPHKANADYTEDSDNETEEKDRLKFIQSYGKVDGCSLTVFTGNVRALKFYENLGYIKADHSPRDRKLRGRIVKPYYYVLINYV